MNTNDTTLSDDDGFTDTDRFHADFEHQVRKLMEPVRDILLEHDTSARPEEIIAQLLMNFLGGTDFPHFDDSQVHDSTSGHFIADQKAFMVRMADHMGPDWAQALYHAAVFITKVA